MEKAARAPQILYSQGPHGAFSPSLEMETSNRLLGAHLKFIHQFSLVYINTHVEQSHTGLSYNMGLADGNGWA